MRTYTKESSAIEQFRYDPSISILEITFRGGRVYCYHDVPGERVHQMLQTSQLKQSIGKFYHANIRNKYVGTPGKCSVYDAMPQFEEVTKQGNPTSSTSSRIQFILESITD